MRKLKQIVVVKSTLLGIAEDGTFWRAEMDFAESDNLKWMKLEGPPEGEFRPEKTIEEIGDTLKKKGQRMILGRGLKDET